MTVIILTTAASVSGGARQALYLGKALQDMGKKVYFVCWLGDETHAIAQEMGLTCVGLSKSLKSLNLTLKKLMEPGEKVVLHAFHNRGIKIAGYLGTLWRLQGLPVVCTIHRGVTRRPGNPLPYLLPGIRYYMVNSLAAGRTLPLLWRKKRCGVVDNAIPPERLQPTRDVATMRKELEIPDEHIILGNIAHHKVAKGAEELIRAYAKARESLPPSTLIIVGVRPERIAHVPKELGIEDYCRLIPRTQLVADYLQLMSLLIFASRFIESQPNVILEAMCMGIPVIGSSVGGIPELLPGDCIFNPKDIDEIAFKIVEMINNPGRLQQLSVINKAQHPMYSTENRMAVIISYYNWMLAEWERRPPGKITGKIMSFLQKQFKLDL